jgi:hypothetical protein
MTKTLEEIANLTYDEAKNILAQAVAVRGEDFIYPEDEKITPSTCAYTREVDGKLTGSCVVGVALIDIMGIDPTLIGGSTFSADVLLDRSFGVKNSSVRSLFASIQWKQDTGTAWGVALDQAITELNTLAARRAELGVDTDKDKD